MDTSSSILNILIPVVATLATALGTFFIARRHASSTFVADLIKQVEFYRGRTHALEKEILLVQHERDAFKHDYEVLERAVRGKG